MSENLEDTFYGPAIPLVHTHTHTQIQKDTCTKMFIIALEAQRTKLCSGRAARPSLLWGPPSARLPVPSPAPPPTPTPVPRGSVLAIHRSEPAG